MAELEAAPCPHVVHRARRRPLIFDMMQWDGTSKSISMITSWVGNAGPSGGPGFIFKKAGFFARLREWITGRMQDDVCKVYDKWHETWITVFRYQWVVKGVRGEFYAITDETLYASYEFVCYPHVPEEA
jgi:hypothetical protein